MEAVQIGELITFLAVLAGASYMAPIFGIPFPFRPTSLSPKPSSILSNTTTVPTNINRRCSSKSFFPFHHHQLPLVSRTLCTSISSTLRFGYSRMDSIGFGVHPNGFLGRLGKRSELRVERPSNWGCWKQGVDRFGLGAGSGGRCGGTGGFGTSGDGNSGGGGEEKCEEVCLSIPWFVRWVAKQINVIFLQKIGVGSCCISVGTSVLLDIVSLSIQWLLMLILSEILFLYCLVMLAIIAAIALCSLVVVNIISAAQQGEYFSNISNLPSFTFHQVSRPEQQEVPDLGSQNSWDSLAHAPEDVECCICLSQFGERAEKQTLPCQHCFHSVCIETWLRINSTCPACRSSIYGIRSSSALGTMDQVGSGQTTELEAVLSPS